MKVQNPIELHAHSCFSFLDALASPEELVTTAKSYGYEALALTDHGGLFGVPRFLRAAVKADLKAIVGCELYISPTTRSDRAPDLRPVGHHLTLLAESPAGYENLAQLSTLGYCEGFYHRPRVDRELLSRHSGDLILLTGSIHSFLCQKLLASDPKAADEWLDFCLETFGRDSVFIEIQDHGGEKEAALAEKLMRMGKSRKLRHVLTNDVHYLRADDAEAHEIVMDIRSKKLPTDPRRERFQQRTFHLLRHEEWASRLEKYPGATDAARDIAKRCKVAWKDIVPVSKKAAAAEGAETLRDSVMRAARARFGKVTAEIERRIHEEVEGLEKAGLCGYIGMIAELVAEARREKIAVGPGRGSAAGSLVAYLLEITEIDPLAHGLSFDRFLSPSRATLPDVDVDIDYRERDRLIEILRRQRPDETLFRPGACSTVGLKSAVREVARCRGIPYQDVNVQLRDIAAGESTMEAQSSGVWKDLPPIINKVAPLPRTTQVHPTAIVLLPPESAARLPLYQSPVGERWLQFDGEDLDAMRIPKLDLLPLKILAAMSDAVRWLKMSGVDTVNFSSMPPDDADTFRMLSEGRTTGLFQLESAGMRELLRDLQPRTLDDLAAALALYRPGPIEAGIPRQFIERKRGDAAADPPHELFRDILRETHGLVLYQEQVMACARRVGLTAEEADRFRIAASKKDPAALADIRKRFETALRAAGLDDRASSDLLAQILPQAEFSYNKSHAISYAILTYRGAYLKAHHPAFFLTACVNQAGDERERLGEIFMDMRRKGIEIAPPDVNLAGMECYPDPDGRRVRLGLHLIRHLPEQTAHEILKARPFSDMADLLMKVPGLLSHPQALEALTKAGALDDFGKSRNEILAGSPAWISRIRDSISEGGLQEELFASTPEPRPAPAGSPAPVAETAGRSDLLHEHEIFGFFATSSPIDRYHDLIREFCTGTIEDALAQARTAPATRAGGGPPDQKKAPPVTVAGLLTQFRAHVDRAGRDMAFGTLEDGTGKLDIVMFHDVYVRSKLDVTPGAPLLVRGRLEKRGPFATLLTDQVVGMDHPEQLYECILIKLDEGIGMDALRRITKILRAHPGDRPVHIDMMDAGRSYEFQAGWGCRPSAVLRRELEDLLGNFAVFFLKKRESVPARV